jgi:hypothetical protein
VFCREWEELRIEWLRRRVNGPTEARKEKSPPSKTEDGAPNLVKRVTLRATRPRVRDERARIAFGVHGRGWHGSGEGLSVLQGMGRIEGWMVAEEGLTVSTR